MQVRAKKFLGQHFLTDRNLAIKIVNSLSVEKSKNVLEVGPGMGILTDYLKQKEDINLYLVDIDTESIEFLHKKYPELKEKIISGDFLKLDLNEYASGQLSIIGNFPYNISSQILFKVLDNRSVVNEVVGMFQKEVAERIAAKSSSKEYGILSVFMQAYYEIEYLFTVNPGVFNPPPKVKSAVIKCVRKEREHLDCDEKLFFEIVKAAFNQRRKTLRNALRKFITPENTGEKILDLRAEKLNVDDFVKLTNLLSGK
jgi:16S rRNA (adenine1518-N6/adenine1519-N6)-dimethyltransferase